MKLGASTWIWVSPPTDEAIAEIAPKLEGWGFDLMEIPVEAPGDWDPKTAAETLHDHGLGATVCAVMPDDRDLSTTDDGVVGATQDYLRQCVSVAETVGSPVVAGPMYAPVGKTWLLSEDERPEVLRRVAGHLRPVAEFAAERGVVLAIEPLNRYEASLVNTLAQAVELAELVGSTGVGVAADTFHMNIEEQDIAEAIASAAHHLAHVQVAGNHRGTPGDDHFDWRTFAAALRTAGYDGAVCIESFTAHNQTIARAASVWRPLAATQDDIAARGISFLQGVFSQGSEVEQERTRGE